MTTSLKRLAYLPRATYALDLEAFTMAELRQRVGQDEVEITHQYAFYTVVCVTQGACTQVVDFEPVRCGPGSILFVRPGQAHNFGRGQGWEGWLVLFRSESVLPTSGVTRGLRPPVDLERLPDHMALRGTELQHVTLSIEQLREDAHLDGPLEDVNALLLHQLHALLTRLCILHARHQGPAPAASPALQRFKRFQQAVEEHFAAWHQVTQYADRLGCTEKSLTRAVTDAMGMTAKAFIAARIVLEAKRLLVHTDLPISTIADQLGFDEATNFSKFFRREVGSTAAEFRHQQRSAV